MGRQEELEKRLQAHLESKVHSRVSVPVRREVTASLLAGELSWLHVGGQNSKVNFD